MQISISNHRFKNELEKEEYECPREEVTLLIRKSMFYKDK